MELRRELSDSNAGTFRFHQVWLEAVDIRQEAQLVNRYYYRDGMQNMQKTEDFVKE